MYMIYVDIDMIVHAETFMKRFFADSSSGIIQGYLPLANSKEAGQTTSSVGEEGRSGGLPTIGQAWCLGVSYSGQGWKCGYIGRMQFWVFEIQFKAKFMLLQMLARMVETNLWRYPTLQFLQPPF